MQGTAITQAVLRDAAAAVPVAWVLLLAAGMLGRKRQRRQLSCWQLARVCMWGQGQHQHHPGSGACCVAGPSAAGVFVHAAAAAGGAACTTC
jgi:hypothetical protein